MVEGKSGLIQAGGIKLGSGNATSLGLDKADLSAFRCRECGTLGLYAYMPGDKTAYYVVKPINWHSQTLCGFCCLASGIEKFIEEDELPKVYDLS